MEWNEKKLIDLVNSFGEKSDYIPREQLDLIRSDQNLAEKVFLKYLDCMIEEELSEELCNVSFFGIFFLAEFKCKEAFKKIQKVLQSLGNDVHRWLGDALTENLPAIMYSMYDGDRENLFEAMEDRRMYDFSADAFIKIAVQLYIDDNLEKEVLIERMENFEEYEQYDEMGVRLTEVAYNMAKAHVVEFLPVIKRWDEMGWIDESVVGKYADFLDVVYEYKDEQENLFLTDDVIRTDYDMERELGYWYKFDVNERSFKEKAEKQSQRKLNHWIDNLLFDPKSEIGRNDLCPCGSGKKYKKCCLPMVENPGAFPNLIESRIDLRRYLRSYPKTSFDPVTGESIVGFERKEGRPYLEDTYDRESILVDASIYLGLVQRNFGIMTSEQESENNDRKSLAYLKKAYALFKDKFAKENLKTLDEYDEKFSIHYTCGEWLSMYLILQRDFNEDFGDKEEIEHLFPENFEWDEIYD